MKHLVILLELTLAGTASCIRAGRGAPGTTLQEATMTARGTFEVTLAPQPPDRDSGGPFSRLFLDKRFLGDLEATSRGQMLGAETAVEGSGAYVALEQVTGTLNGKRGSFILQHNGTMRQGVYTLHVSVVPDSGTDALIGITGRMTIIIEGGTHRYELEYALGGS
jgi:hypothetical protein